MSAIRLQKLNAILFAGALAAGGVLFAVVPKATISENEKRELARFPEFSPGALFEGRYTRGIDTYYADNFAYRDAWTRLATDLRTLRGLSLDGIRYYAEPEARASVASVAASESPASPPPVQGDTPETASARPVGDTRSVGGPEPYQTINSVIVYRNRAVQVFGGNASAASAFASAVNLYQEALGRQVAVYCMVVPIGSDFHLPSRVGGGRARERLHIEQLYAQLAPGVTPVRAYEALAERIDDYTYFRTDHHWTGLGAYYAYRAFAQAAGFQPLALDALTRKEIPNFLGTLYHHTLDRGLQSNPDTVEYFKVPNRLSASYFPNGTGKGVPAIPYYEQARGGNAYGVFLGGDHPLFRISSDVGNGRRILIVKDSYGNAFVPYLAAHYQDVFIIDYRYFNGSIAALVKEHGIGELLFAHNTFAANSVYAATRARTMLNGAPVRQSPRPTEGAPKSSS